PSSSNPLPNSIPEGSGGNHGAAQIKDLKAQIKQLKKKAKPVISHHNDWIKSVSMKKRLAWKKSLKTKLMQKESVSKQGRKRAKSEPTVHKDPAFDYLDDAMDYMEPEDAYDEGTVKDSEETRVRTDRPKVSTDKLKVSTDKLKVSTDKPNESIAEPNEGTVEKKDGNSYESAAPITVFRDDETIAQFLFAQLANDEEIARKVQEEWKAEEEKKKLAEEEATKAAFTNEHDFIQARLNADKILAKKLQEEEREKFTIEQRAKFLHDTIAAQKRFLAQQRSGAIRNKLPTRNQLRNQMMTYLKYVKKANENFIPIGSAKDEKLIERMNEKAAGMDKKEVSEGPESTKVKAKIKEPKENIKKRSRRRLKMKAPKRSKRQKTNSDHEEENQ
ncbi:hypothetical protein Tco_1494927, partial [Tanacetum coccineum]